VQWVRDLMVSIERGDIDQMSFGFRVAKGGDEWLYTDDAVTRTITKVEELFDVSVVTYPAYPDTDVAVRSLTEWKAAQTITVEPPAAILREIRRRRHRLIVALSSAL
jgi:phage head maturation protease